MKEPLSIPSIARDALKKADNDVIEAASILENQVRKNIALWIEITDSLLSTACYDAVRLQIRQSRNSIWTASGYDKGGKGDRVTLHGNSLLNFPLPGGMLLRDAKAHDLHEAINFYQSQANQMAIIARWLGKIVERIGGKIVKNALDDDELRRLQTEVQS